MVGAFPSLNARPAAALDACNTAEGVSNGSGIRAAEIMGADPAYMGTRFVATREAAAPDAYKTMLIESGSADLVYTGRFLGQT